MINKAHIKIGDVIYGSSDSVDIIYDNTESGLESNNIQDAIDEIAAGACFADGIVVNVEMANWIAQEDRTYTNTVAIEGILESEMYDVSLYGDSTEEQAHAFDFLVTDIDTYDGQIVLTASEEITVAFSVILRGKVNLENKNVYVSDLSATNIEYDNSESNMEATDMQNAIDELATTINGIVVNVTADSWDIQEDGTYKKIIPVEQLTGKEVLDVCLYPGDTHTEEQILAYSELITSIDTIEGRIVLTASEALTVGFRILLYGKIGFEVVEVEGSGNSTSGNAKAITLTQAEYDALSEEEKANGIYVVSDGEDLTSKNLAYDGSVTGFGNNVQDAIDYLDDFLFFKSGNTYRYTNNSSVGLIVAGHLTTSGTAIEFSVYLPKSLKNITSITINELKANIRSSLGTYLINSAYSGSGADLMTAKTVNYYIENDHMISINATFDTALSTSNNIPLTLQFKCIDLTLN